MYALHGDASAPDGLAFRPVAGAVAPAPVAGLSKSHIRPSPIVTFYVGGSLVRFDSREPGDRHGACPKRSEISEFSQKSRQRLRLSLAKVDQNKCGRPIFGTLTYPADFPLDQETFKRHLKIFSQRFLRSFPSAASIGSWSFRGGEPRIFIQSSGAWAAIEHLWESFVFGSRGIGSKSLQAAIRSIC